MNAVEIEEELAELAARPFDPAEFPFAFIQAFGHKATTIKRLRRGDGAVSDVPGGVLHRNHIHLVVAEPGQVRESLQRLRASPRTVSAKTKFILATDGEHFEAEEVASGEWCSDTFARFADHFGFFLALAGITTTKEIKDNPIDVRATGRLNKLYLALLSNNEEWTTDEKRPAMNHFMARLIFCFFAEDTGIFQERGAFTHALTTLTERDGSNTHEVLEGIFRAMNKTREERELERVPVWARQFPYVNGGLFSGEVEVPVFTRAARSYLLSAGELSWKEINPDIFGSMIQAVADEDERAGLGMHYTSVPNILRVLNPLFLDDLRAALAAAEASPVRLLNLRRRMARIRVFDPACGSGNFLVIAYKQMREIEARINELRGERTQRSEIPISNFRGIELREFPAEIARLALIIAEFQCDVLYRGQQDAVADVLPLDSENWITPGNALRMDWLSLCPPTGTAVRVVREELFSTGEAPEVDFENEGGEIYICGNPPYLGAKKKTQEQKDDMTVVGLGDAMLLDYVAAFIIKGLEMVARERCSMALVSTSSICQGEQVGLLWPKIFDSADIDFAYRPFKWANSAAHNAGVYCTIVGLSSESTSAKKLFDGDTETICTSISPYLVPGPRTIVHTRDAPLSELSPMVMGSNAVDGKRLVLEADEARQLLRDWPEVRPYVRPYGGTQELVSGSHRWCYWIEDSERARAEEFPPIASAIEACRIHRLGAGRDAKKAAARPHQFCYRTHQDRDFIQVGNTIGNAFSFVPLTLRPRGFVSNHNAFAIYGGGLVEVAVIASTLHRVWAEAIAGRLGNGVRYGNTVVYNTFPLPALSEQNRRDLERSAENILLARAAEFPRSIADLYDDDEMPIELRAAHAANDDVLERVYMGRRFRNDTERLETLFAQYRRMIEASAARAPTRRTRRAT